MNVIKGTVKVGDGELPYFTFGEGEKICVIIPGMSLKPVADSAEAVAERYRVFGNDYKIYVFDRRADLNAENSTVANMTYELTLAMKELGISDAYIIGVSQGGMMAQFMAAEYPEFVKKAVIASSLAKHNSVSTALFGRWRDLAFGNKPEILVDDIFKNLYSKEVYNKSRDTAEILAKSCTQEELKRFGYLSDACFKFDFFEELKKIKCPVFVIGAENDKVMAAKGSYEIADRLGCEIYMYRGCPHAVYDEVEDYVERIMNFFEK